MSVHEERKGGGADLGRWRILIGSSLLFFTIGLQNPEGPRLQREIFAKSAKEDLKLSPLSTYTKVTDLNSPLSYKTSFMCLSGTKMLEHSLSPNPPDTRHTRHTNI